MSGLRKIRHGGVTEGTRTPDIRDHNPALYQLSYGHHADPARQKISGEVPNNDSHTRAGGVEWVPTRPRGYRAAAIPLAVSTSGPGSGTKIVRR